jgi:hypothetical protein
MQPQFARISNQQNEMSKTVGIFRIHLPKHLTYLESPIRPSTNQTLTQT